MVKVILDRGHMWVYQTLPDPVLAERVRLVLLVWCLAALPHITTPHMHATWVIWFGQGHRYHSLPWR